MENSDYLALKNLPKLRRDSSLITHTREDYSRYKRSRLIQDVGNHRRREDLLRLAMEEKSNLALEKIDRIQKATSCLLASQAMTQTQTPKQPRFPPVFFKTMDGIKNYEDVSPMPIRFKSVTDFPSTTSEKQEFSGSSQSRSTKSRESQNDYGDIFNQVALNSSGGSLDVSKNGIMSQNLMEKSKNQSGREGNMRNQEFLERIGSPSGDGKTISELNQMMSQWSGHQGVKLEKEDIGTNEGHTEKHDQKNSKKRERNEECIEKLGKNGGNSKENGKGNEPITGTKEKSQDKIKGKNSSIDSALILDDRPSGNSLDDSAKGPNALESAKGKSITEPITVSFS